VLDGSGGGDIESKNLNALLHADGYAGDVDAVGVLGNGEAAQLLLELGVAKEEAQGAAEVVELFGRDTLHLVVARGKEPGILAIQDEEFPGGLVVAPTHTAGFFEEESPGFGAIESHACVALGVVGTERGETVVVVVYLAEKSVGILGVCEGGEKEQWEKE